MKKIVLLALSMLMGNVSYAEDITISYKGSSAKVTQTTKDSVNVTVNGAKVSVESQYTDHKLTLLLKGKSDDGQLILKTAGKAKIKLDGLNLTSQEGAPLHVNHKAAVIWAKSKLIFSGKGTLNVIATGDGCRGIKTKKDIIIEDLTLNVTTSGNHLGEKPFSFGFPGFPGFGNHEENDSTMHGGFPDFGGGFPGFPGGFPMGNDSTMRGGFPDFGGGFPGFPGGFPMGNDSTMRGGFPDFGGGFPGFPGGFPMGNDSTMRGGFPDFGGGFPFGNRDENDSVQGGFGGFAGKHKYVASTKGIASKGTICINSGNVTVRTSTAGAEGIEGKKGIVFNDGNVDVLSPDDAINANATIVFNGSHVVARSTGNDAVDSNPEGGFFMPFGGNNTQNPDSAIVINGGTVIALSQVGSPEEGLDCDFSPLYVEGGTIFTVGGGMGEMPSVPTNATAKQPTVLLIGVNIVKDDPKVLEKLSVPFSLRRSASLVGSPAFKLGNTYTVKTTGYEKTFTINENFTTIR